MYILSQKPIYEIFLISFVGVILEIQCNLNNNFIWKEEI